MKGLKIDCQAATKKICQFLREEFSRRNKTRAVLGVSGGVDSAVVAFLCKRADLDLHPVFMPYAGLSNRERVWKLIEILDLPQGHFIEIDIAEMVDAQIGGIKGKTGLDEIDKGNIMARQRMIIQYALARSLNGLVVGTENLSEYDLGYFTLHGDSACDINPIGRLLKTQVIELAKFLGVSSEIIEQKPSAELYEGQTDEGEFGFSYQDADSILFLSCVRKISKEKIIDEYKFDPDLVERVLKRVKATQYKREVIPTINF